jgi:hypothetical protein
MMLVVCPKSTLRGSTYVLYGGGVNTYKEHFESQDPKSHELLLPPLVAKPAGVCSDWRRFPGWLAGLLNPKRPAGSSCQQSKEDQDAIAL